MKTADPAIYESPTVYWTIHQPSGKSPTGAFEPTAAMRNEPARTDCTVTPVKACEDISDVYCIGCTKIVAPDLAAAAATDAIAVPEDIVTMPRFAALPVKADATDSAVSEDVAPLFGR
jgi:hypothetical protein